MGISIPEVTVSDSPQQFDAGHISFLELIRVISNIAGAPFAAGALLKTGIGMAGQAEQVQFPDFDSFLESVERGSNAIARFEGVARHYGDGVFGLPACPFAQSISTYRQYVGDLPTEYASVTKHLNRHSATTQKLRVGHGASVSPFCGVHQPCRSALAERIRVGGKPLIVHQLGCRSGAGSKGIADDLLADVGVDRELVARVLDECMCCYCARVCG